METSKLNEYIKYYLQKDKTKSAIMLDAPWGAGKSYYINEELIPYLKNKENGGYTCIVVSLFGLSNLFDVSKSIYLEIRAKALTKKSEIMSAGKILAKTVLKGVTSYRGVDLSINEDDLIELYQSIDLKNKLIIFEDLERSEIEIKQILGYVNNLVEQDGVKVLLVANENEFIKYDYVDNENAEEGSSGKIKKYTSETYEYLRTKEKTINDTIHFNCDYISAFKNIVKSFDNDQLNLFLDEMSIQDIDDIFYLTSQKNLRTFVYACQKTVGIFDALKEYNLLNEITLENKKCIFYSIIYFCRYIKSDSFPKWEGTEYISFELGSEKYPLHKFCYDYIRWHDFDKENVLKSFDAHKNCLLYDERGSKNDEDLIVLSSYSLYSEEDVLKYLDNVNKRLDDPKNIPFYDYGKLAVCFIKLNTILDYDYSKCKEKMKNNIKDQGTIINAELLFSRYVEFDSEKEKDLFIEFKNEILNAMRVETNINKYFDYEPSKVNEFSNYVRKHKAEISSRHKFISDFEIDELVDFVFKCNPAQLVEFRDILFMIYRHAYKSDFVEDDCDFMQIFKDKLMKKSNFVVDNSSQNSKSHFDRIVLKQIEWLCKNLDAFIEQLS